MVKLKKHLVNVLGPKGMGKTSALKELANVRGGLYVDLALLQGNDDLQTCLFTSHLDLYMDNAQLFLDLDQCGIMPNLTGRFTVAAFSPGATIESKCRLKKRCVDGENGDFYFRPFTLTEARDLFAANQKLLSEDDLISCYHLANGSPRYMLSFIEHGNFGSMFQEISDQFCQCQNYKEFNNMCQKIIALSAGDIGLMSDWPTKMGMTYCTNHYGMGAFKPSNILFVYHAIASQKGLSFGLKWKELEFLTSYVVVPVLK